MPSAVVVSSARRRPRRHAPPSTAGAVLSPTPSAAASLKLADLPEDTLLSLLRHLSLGSLHALLLAAPSLVCPLLRPVVLATSAGDLASLRLAAAAAAVTASDLSLLRFALHLPHAAMLPADGSHPLRALYASAAAAEATLPAVMLLARSAMEAGGGAKHLLAGVEKLADGCVHTVARLASGRSAREPSLKGLAVRLAHSGRSEAAQDLLAEWPWVGEPATGDPAGVPDAGGAEQGSGLCRHYSLLHAAASAGDLALARALRTPHGPALLSQSTCAGDNPASIALEKGHLSLFREFLAPGWGITGLDARAREKRVLEAALPAVAKQMRDVD